MRRLRNEHETQLQKLPLPPCRLLLLLLRIRRQSVCGVGRRLTTLCIADPIDGFISPAATVLRTLRYDKFGGYTHTWTDVAAIGHDCQVCLVIQPSSDRFGLVRYTSSSFCLTNREGRRGTERAEPDKSRSHAANGHQHRRRRLYNTSSNVRRPLISILSASVQRRRPVMHYCAGELLAPQLGNRARRTGRGIRTGQTRPRADRTTRRHA